MHGMLHMFPEYAILASHFVHLTVFERSIFVHLETKVFPDGTFWFEDEIRAEQEKFKMEFRLTTFIHYSQNSGKDSHSLTSH